MSCSVCLNKEVKGWVSHVRVTRPSISSLYALLHLVFAIFGVRCCQLCTGCGDSLQIEWVTKTLRKGQLPFRRDVPAFSVWSAWFKIWICTFYFTKLMTEKCYIFKMPFKISRGCLHLLQRDGGNIFLPSSFCFSCIVYHVFYFHLLCPSSLLLCFYMLLCMHSWVLY